MRFDWLGRLAIGVGAMGVLAVLLGCEFAAFVRPWLTDDLGVCFVNQLFAPPPEAGDPFLTPPEIVPEWYLLPHYGMMRSITFNLGPIDSKALGLIVIGASFIAPLTLAFFNWSKTPARAWLTLLVIPPVLIGLGWIGLRGYDGAWSNAGQALVVLYFAVFWVVFPLLARTDQALT
jgi:quinol-cytochrome oxidoreductase complex cytochrome b subunit